MPFELCQDLFEIPRDQVHNTEALVTILAGKTVFEREGDWEKPYEFIDFDGLHDD